MKNKTIYVILVLLVIALMITLFIFGIIQGWVDSSDVRCWKKGYSLGGYYKDVSDSDSLFCYTSEINPEARNQEKNK